MAVDSKAISSRTPTHFILLQVSVIAATAVLDTRTPFYTIFISCITGNNVNHSVAATLRGEGTCVRHLCSAAIICQPTCMPT